MLLHVSGRISDFGFKHKRVHVFVATLHSQNAPHYYFSSFSHRHHIVEWPRLDEHKHNSTDDYHHILFSIKKQNSLLYLNLFFSYFSLSLSLSGPLKPH